MLKFFVLVTMLCMLFGCYHKKVQVPASKLVSNNNNNNNNKKVTETTTVSRLVEEDVPPPPVHVVHPAVSTTTTVASINGVPVKPDVQVHETPAIIAGPVRNPQP